MKVADILQATAVEYAIRKIADIRKVTGKPDEDLDWRGTINNSEGQPTRPVGMVMVVTPRPEEVIEIVTGDFRNPSQVTQDALDDLASLVLYRQGRAGVLWINAGQPMVAGGNVLVNAARHFQASLEREDGGMSWKPEERVLRVDQFVPVKLAKARRSLVMDWMAACVLDPTHEPEAPSEP